MSLETKSLPSLVIRAMSVGMIFLILTIPFHTFLTVSLSDKIGHLILLTAWKEILVVLISILALYLLMYKPDYLKTTDKWLLSLTLLYVILHLIYLLVGDRSLSATASMAINTRFMIVFWLGWVLASFIPRLTPRLVNLIITTSVIVALIGFALVVILPVTTLEVFGYDPPGINTPGVPPAYHTVASSGLVRAQSTLRGPNALGAFLILPITLLLFYRPSDRNLQLIIYGALALMAQVLLLTYSRSSWIAIIVVLVLWISTRHHKWIGKHMVVLSLSLLITALLVLSLARSSLFRSIVLHEGNGVVSSNEGHWNALLTGSKDVLTHPLGGGLGSAGPASALPGGSPKISENYFLQIGQELGWIGLGLLIALHAVLGYKLWLMRSHKFVLPVLYAFIGLTIANFLLHVWTDEAVAITFWGLAGAVLGAAIIEQKTIKNENNKTKTNQRNSHS